ncbi:MAG: hypothetical protein LBG97_02155 [Coriobacteriales bacterium]|nr:hypothetical protein [Coriobacteriales bacterium]
MRRQKTHTKALLKSLVATSALCIILAFAIFGVAWAGSKDDIALPEPILPETLCPVAKCTQPDGSCHASAAAPEPDGSFAMICPKVSCSEYSCHAWERVSSSSKPSDAAMNLWIITPVVLVLGLIILVKKVR